ncbi:FkbM family methyltransferase [Halarcobacter ebronensis]|uniref:Methyltransferase FkbM domain-containing protein n=1 Tax=Halarcobacter ebronensis TaxID=1462615 RepID=A0A4Q1AXH6_9BACT|nr:FkbM family methyltransferase [Halarcobacter ebronensis]QKF83313.1 methyltransferase [Halarcobacter ebronensis]RXK05875.1 hypothetical protein CRV07_07325 [Halarcobacter ebronensis]
MKESIRKILFPLPRDQQKQGFEPNFYIKFLRGISKVLIGLFKLNGVNRFSNEFIQILEPKIKIPISSNDSILFRTGHGRLLWRAKTLLTEEPMTIEWIDRFSENDIFYDIGANVGNYSIYAAKKSIRSFAFEPEILNLSLLYENIFLNNVEKLCTPVPFAVHDETALEKFYLKDISKGDALHSIGNKSYLLENPDLSTKVIDTFTMSLDDLIKNYNIPSPTKLKIDVDNNELNVILGANKALESVKEICVELDLNFSEHVKVKEILEEKSFEIICKENGPINYNTNIANYIFRKGFKCKKQL